MTLRDLRIGGPCTNCGLTQRERSACTRSREECPYGKDHPPVDFAATLAALVPQAKPMRLARMLRLYVAATEGLTQKQLAQKAGVNESTVSRFLSGEQMPDGRAFAALLAYCLGEHESP